MIGDGMGISHISTSLISSKNDQFKKFSSVGLVITTSADNLITDSAAGATAFATGNRTNNAMVSIDPNGNSLQTILEIAEKKKMSTGVVVTSSLTNATPACFISHVKHRNMEFEIAEQLIHSGVDFALGGGTDFFLPVEQGGKREDHKNFVDSLKSLGYDFFNEFNKIEISPRTKKVAAILGKNGLARAGERNYSLGDMAKQALSFLSKNKNGFFLMIEGSQIDWASHSNDQKQLLEEMDDFNSAIEEVLKFAQKEGNTLVVVTADHEAGGMSINDGSLEKKTMDLRWTTKKHTASMVGIFSFGPGSEKFGGIQDNFIIGRKLIKLIDYSKF